jgi:hypothetical protein
VAPGMLTPGFIPSGRFFLVAARTIRATLSGGIAEPCLASGNAAESGDAALNPTPSFRPEARLRWGDPPTFHGDLSQRTREFAPGASGEVRA